MIFENDDQTARFFYLALLGMFLVWGLFLGQRHRLSGALRDAAIWGLIFVTAITAYGFKDVFLAQILPAQARMIDARTVALTRQSDGHFHALMQLNGQPVEMLVDTGATDIVLSREDAARIGLDVDNLAFLGSANTANGVVSTARATLNRVQLGEIIDYDLRASVNGGELSGSLLGLAYLDLFRSWSVEGDTMILRR